MLFITIPSNRQFEHFPTPPSTYAHFSTQTPLVSPEVLTDDPIALPTASLLACGDVCFSNSSSPIDTTTPPTPAPPPMHPDAAHGQSARRPTPSPIQNMLHTTSDDSDSNSDNNSNSSSSSSTGMRASSIDLARCSRCHRTPSIDLKTGKNNMVQYGLNLWYCTRCAQLVGLGHR